MEGNIEKELYRERKIAHLNRKYLRVKPIVLIQRYMWIVTIVLIVVITFLLGLYNIRDIVYLNQNAKYVKEGVVRNLIREYMDKNFFVVNPSEVEKRISENTYVKSVKVEKVFPNKLSIEINEYTPFVILETEDAKCKIFSQEGIFLEVREEQKCETISDKEEVIYFTGGSNYVITENGKEYFYLADDIYNISKILKEFDIKIKSVSIKGNILNVVTDNMSITLDINQNLTTEYARLLIVLKELKNMNIKASSIDVRFKRPVLIIDK